jgi:hypothetical protein
MLVIRQEQMEALRKDRLEQFEARMVAHLKQLMPERCATLGDEAMRHDIRHGMARAAAYDITAERDVARYLELALRLGRDFDSSPSTPWARPILVDRSSSAENRLRRLRSMARRQTQTTR